MSTVKQEVETGGNWKDAKSGKVEKVGKNQDPPGRSRLSDFSVCVCVCVDSDFWRDSGRFLIRLLVLLLLLLLLHFPPRPLMNNLPPSHFLHPPQPVFLLCLFSLFTPRLSSSPSLFPRTLLRHPHPSFDLPPIHHTFHSINVRRVLQPILTVSF